MCQQTKNAANPRALQIHRDLLRSFAFEAEDPDASKYVGVIFDHRYCYVLDGRCRTITAAARRGLLEQFRSFPDAPLAALCDAEAVRAALASPNSSTRGFLAEQIVLAHLEAKDWHFISEHLGVTVGKSHSRFAQRIKFNPGSEKSACQQAVDYLEAQQKHSKCVLLVPSDWNFPNVDGVLVLRQGPKKYVLVFLQCTLSDPARHDHSRRTVFKPAPSVASSWRDAVNAHLQQDASVKLRWLWVARHAIAEQIHKDPNIIAHVEDSVPFSMFHADLANL